MRTQQWTAIVMISVGVLAGCSSDASTSEADPTVPAESSAGTGTDPDESTSVPTATVPPTTVGPTMAAASTTSTTVPSSTTDPVTTASTTAPTTTAAPTTTLEATAPPTTAPTGPFEIVGGMFDGIGLGTDYATAVAALPALAEPALAEPPSTVVPLCSISAPFSELRHDGALSVLFEGDDLASSVITNWYYDGSGRPDGLRLVARGGVGIGSTRAAVAAAYPDADVEFPVDLVDVDNFRIGFDDDNVAYFAVIVCGD